MTRYIVTVIFAALLILPGTGATAEEDSERARIRLTGVRALAGIVLPEDADTGLVLGAAVDLGTVWKPWMHLSAGVTRWSSDLDSAAYTNREGSMRDLRLFTTVGMDLIEVSRVQSYVDVGFGMHFAKFDIPTEPALADALDGTNFGAEAGFGLATALSAFRVSTEIRRQFVDDTGNWTFVVGLGKKWGGRKAAFE